MHKNDSRIFQCHNRRHPGESKFTYIKYSNQLPAELLGTGVEGLAAGVNIEFERVGEVCNVSTREIPLFAVGDIMLLFAAPSAAAAPFGVTAAACSALLDSVVVINCCCEAVRAPKNISVIPRLARPVRLDSSLIM